jgi:outer membrane translocation and assembly module TamA
VRWDTSERASATADAEVGNLFGQGLTLGGRYRYGARVNEQRASLHVPSVGGLGDATASLFRLTEDVLTLQEAGFPFKSMARSDQRTQRGVSLQQVARFAHPWDLLYGYRLQRDFDTSATPVLETVGAVSLSAARDTRLNPFDPRRGTFFSLSLESGQRWLGSDVAFEKAFGQVFLTRQLTPSWTWAHAYRLGLAWGLGNPRPSVFVERTGAGTRAERFRAGGPNTLRGFDVDAVGSRDVNGDPAGGQAVIILNQELRYMHPRGYGAALFWDAGNVFPTVSALSARLRHDFGAGLRWESPVGLVRLDVGIPLNRRPGEDAYRIQFGLGQAF